MANGVYGGHADKDVEGRGTSMVEKHFQKLQQEKEEAANVKLQGLMPLFGQKVRNEALLESDWNPEKAALLLRRFHVANASRLKHLHKKRKRIFSALTKAAKDGDRDRGGSFSDSEEDGVAFDSDSDVSRGSERRSKKSKGNDNKGKHKKDKKRKSKKSGGTPTKKQRSSSKFGKYGIVREADYDSKRGEFVKWATEVRGIDTESYPRAEEMKLFADYAEDFNTGTLPHAKYYDLETYNRRKEKKESKKKRSVAADFRFNDEKERQKEKDRKRTEDHNRRIQEAYYELKTSEKASDMKQQELLRMQMKLAYKTGDTFTAGKLADRLKPDDPNDTSKPDVPNEEW